MARLTSLARVLIGALALVGMLSATGCSARPLRPPGVRTLATEYRTFVTDGDPAVDEVWIEIIDALVEKVATSLRSEPERRGVVVLLTKAKYPGVEPQFGYYRASIDEAVLFSAASGFVALQARARARHHQEASAESASELDPAKMKALLETDRILFEDSYGTRVAVDAYLNLAHELAHQAVHHAALPSRPRWLNEGVAEALSYEVGLHWPTEPLPLPFELSAIYEARRAAWHRHGALLVASRILLFGDAGIEVEDAEVRLSWTQSDYHSRGRLTHHLIRERGLDFREIRAAGVDAIEPAEIESFARGAIEATRAAARERAATSDAWAELGRLLDRLDAGDARPPIPARARRIVAAILEEELSVLARERVFAERGGLPLP